MDHLDELRADLTEDERTLLTAIWSHFRERKSWIPCRVLHLRFRDIPPREALEDLGGSVVFENWVEGEKRYQLTFLGVLLTEEGSQMEALVTRYLDYVWERCLADPEFNTVRSRELEAALSLTPEESRTLEKLLELGGLRGSGMSSQEEWTTTVPMDIEDLVSKKSATKYLRDRALKDYRPGIPLSEAARWQYMGITTDQSELSDEFSFVSHPGLREQIGTDWGEVQLAHKAGAWKSCVVLCGGILEGMLLDVLSRDEPRAQAAYRQLRGGRALELERWALVDLVDVAEETGALDKGAVHLSHALREYRNLIHPGRQIREVVKITEEEAEMAINVVRICRRALSRSGG